MALELTTTKTSSILTINGEHIDLGFIANSYPVPNATLPSFIQLARNTSVPVPQMFQSVRVYQKAKSRNPYVIYANSVQVVNPETIKPDSPEVQVVQIGINQLGDKKKVTQMDLLAPNLKSLLAQNLATWLMEQRSKIEFAILESLTQSCNNTQNKILASKGDDGATTFTKGAHLQREVIDTPEKAVKSFWEAGQVLRKIGGKSAKTNYDRQNRFTDGFLASDMLCLCSHEFLFQLTSKGGLITSSEGYNEIFKRLDIQRAYGFNLMPLQTMPDGVNFIFITTGALGAFAYNSAVDGAQLEVTKASEWVFNKVAHMSLAYIAAVVNESFIIASVTPDYKVPEMNAVVPEASKVELRAAESFVELDNVGFMKNPSEERKTYPSAREAAKMNNEATDEVINESKKTHEFNKKTR